MERYSVIFLSGTEGGEVLYALSHYCKRIATGYAWPSDELCEEYSSSGYQAYGSSQDIPGDGKHPSSIWSAELSHRDSCSFPWCSHCGVYITAWCIHTAHWQHSQLEWCGSAECGEWAACAVTLVTSLYAFFKPPNEVAQGDSTTIQMWRRDYVASLINEKSPLFHHGHLPHDSEDTLGIIQDDKGNYMSVLTFFLALLTIYPQPKFPFAHSAIEEIIAAQNLGMKFIKEYDPPTDGLVALGATAVSPTSLHTITQFSNTWITSSGLVSLSGKLVNASNPNSQRRHGNEFMITSFMIFLSLRIMKVGLRSIHWSWRKLGTIASLPHHFFIIMLLFIINCFLNHISYRAHTNNTIEDSEDEEPSSFVLEMPICHHHVGPANIPMPPWINPWISSRSGGSHVWQPSTETPKSTAWAQAEWWEYMRCDILVVYSHLTSFILHA